MKEVMEINASFWEQRPLPPWAIEYAAQVCAELACCIAMQVLCCDSGLVQQHQSGFRICLSNVMRVCLRASGNVCIYSCMPLSSQLCHVGDSCVQRLTLLPCLCAPWCISLPASCRMPIGGGPALLPPSLKPAFAQARVLSKPRAPRKRCLTHPTRCLTRWTITHRGCLQDVGQLLELAEAQKRVLGPLCLPPAKHLSAVHAEWFFDESERHFSRRAPREGEGEEEDE